MKKICYTALLLSIMGFSSPGNASDPSQENCDRLPMRSFFIEIFTYRKFHIIFPKNGTFDDFIATLKDNVSLNPLIDPHNFRVMAKGSQIYPNHSNHLRRIDQVLERNIDKIVILPYENGKYASLKEDLTDYLQEKRTSLIDALNALYRPILESTPIDNIPYLDDQIIQTFINSAKEVYHLVHQNIAHEDRYPITLFKELLYQEIKAAATTRSETTGKEDTTTQNIKRSFFPSFIRFDLNGESIEIDTESDHYRDQTKGAMILREFLQEKMRTVN